MWLLVGLGNPGDSYAGQRHNIGFMALDAIMRRAEPELSWQKKFHGLCMQSRSGGSKWIALKPQTMMNNSGLSVAQAAKFYKIEPGRIVIFHDELDLEPGQVRTKQGGGAAGHNGIRSVQMHLGTPDFWRVRLGIGHPGRKEQVTPHVLGNFSKTDQLWLERVLEALGRHYETIFSDGPKAYERAVQEDTK